MTAAPAIRCGDTVRHGPTGETWVVAWVERDRLAWAGWPPGEALLADCTLVEAASDAEHLYWARQIGRPERTDYIAHAVRRLYPAAFETEPAPEPAKESHHG